jgi:hypothetical protein
MSNLGEHHRPCDKSCDKSCDEPCNTICDKLCLTSSEDACEKKRVTHNFQVVLGECKVTRDVKVTHCITAQSPHQGRCSLQTQALH